MGRRTLLVVLAGLTVVVAAGVVVLSSRPSQVGSRQHFGALVLGLWKTAN
jgi:hypothetical protein